MEYFHTRQVGSWHLPPSRAGKQPPRLINGSSDSAKTERRKHPKLVLAELSGVRTQHMAACGGEQLRCFVQTILLKSGFAGGESGQSVPSYKPGSKASAAAKGWRHEKLEMS